MFVTLNNTGSNIQEFFRFNLGQKFLEELLMSLLLHSITSCGRTSSFKPVVDTKALNIDLWALILEFIKLETFLINNSDETLFRFRLDD